MKKSPRVLRPTIEPRLRAYSTSATAALATMAAATVATTASAQFAVVHASDLDPHVAGTIASVDNTGPGFHSLSVAPMTLLGFSFGAHGFQNNFITGRPEHMHFARGVIYLGFPSASFAFSGFGTSAKNFAFGQHIDGAAFNGDGRVLFRTSIYHPNAFVLGAGRAGHFLPAGSHTPATGYVGIKLFSHYGWLHVQVGQDANGRPNSFALTPGPHTGDVVAAFNTTDYRSAITAGQVSAIPEPASVATGLALFALGAAGVREHRRRKRVA